MRNELKRLIGIWKMRRPYIPGPTSGDSTRQAKQARTKAINECINDVQHLLTSSLHQTGGQNGSNEPGGS